MQAYIVYGWPPEHNLTVCWGHWENSSGWGGVNPQLLPGNSNTVLILYCHCLRLEVACAVLRWLNYDRCSRTPWTNSLIQCLRLSPHDLACIIGTEEFQNAECETQKALRNQVASIAVSGGVSCWKRCCGQGRRQVKKMCGGHGKRGAQAYKGGLRITAYGELKITAVVWTTEFSTERN